MANRSNHYEAAFEAYVRSLRVPCVAVDEANRALSGEQGVKNPDFLLYPRWSLNLVVEVKGKREQERQRRTSTLGELGHDRRPRRSGTLAGDVRPRLPRGAGVCVRRAVAAVPVAAETMGRSSSGAWRTGSGRSGSTTTSLHLRSRGPAWKAVAMARAEFRRRVRPLREWLPMTVGIAATPPTAQGAQPMTR